MADELICIDTECRHSRRMHSVLGCFYQYRGNDKRQCACKRPFMQVSGFRPGTPRADHVRGLGSGLVGIDEVLGALNEANLKAGEVLGAVAELTAVLRNVGMDLEAIMELNAAATGQAQPAPMVEAYVLLSQALESVQSATREMETVTPAVSAAVEKHNEMIGRLSG